MIVEVNSLGEKLHMRNLEEEEVPCMDDKHTGVVPTVDPEVPQRILGWWRDRDTGGLSAPLE